MEIQEQCFCPGGLSLICVVSAWDGPALIQIYILPGFYHTARWSTLWAHGLRTLHLVPRPDGILQCVFEKEKGTRVFSNTACHSTMQRCESVCVMLKSVAQWGHKDRWWALSEVTTHSSCHSSFPSSPSPLTALLLTRMHRCPPPVSSRSRILLPLLSPALSHTSAPLHFLYTLPPQFSTSLIFPNFSTLIQPN